MIKVAVKFCGGCDPTYDRVNYWEQIRSIAGAQVEWGRLGDSAVEAVLLINGCERACAEKKLEIGKERRVFSIKDGKLNPVQVVKILLEHWRNYDKDQERLHQKP